MHLVIFMSMNFIHRQNDRTQPNRDQRMGQTSGFVLATGCYRNVPFENRGKGDIIAFRSNYGSGHMGTVSTNGNYISALLHGIKESSVKYFSETHITIDRTTVWRYTCGQGELGLEETSDKSTRTESPVANRKFRVMPV